MSQPRKHTTILVLKRHNMGLRTKELAEKLEISKMSVVRIERGLAVSRLLASKYLGFFGIDMNSPETIPPELKIIDEGVNVKISSI